MTKLQFKVSINAPLSKVYDCMLGLRYIKQYKQFKMYNDPNLNPQLYAEK